MRQLGSLEAAELSSVLDVAVVTSQQLSATLRLTGLGWTSRLKMTQSTTTTTTTAIPEQSNIRPRSNIVSQLLMKIRARVSSQQKQSVTQYQVKIPPVQRSQSIHPNPSGLCQRCSYKLMTEQRECGAHNTVNQSVCK